MQHHTKSAQRRPVLGFSALIALAALVSSPVATHAQAPDKAAASCISSMNKGAALHAKAGMLVGSACAKEIAKAGTGDFWACVAADAKGKVAKGQALLEKFNDKKCAVAPPFGYAEPSVIAGASTLAVHGLLGGLLGDAASTALASGDKATSQCQGVILKQAAGALNARLAAFAACKKAAMKAGDLETANNLEDDCFAAILADGKGKIGKSATKIALLAGKKCNDPDLAFPGDCVGAEDFAACVGERAACASCRLLNGADALSRDCDLFDDGDVNNSCSTCGNGITEVGEECDSAGASACCSSECVAINPGGSCDDADECTILDACEAGVCVGETPPTTETRLQDDFDNGTLDPAWSSAFSGVATGWTTSESGTQFEVADIALSADDTWGYAALSQSVTPTQDFRLSFSIAWDQGGFAAPIQNLTVMARNNLGDPIVSAGFNDAWVGANGETYWGVPDCGTLCGVSGLNSEPNAGSLSFVIERSEGILEIREGIDVLYSGAAPTDEVESIVIDFGHWRYSLRPNGHPSFGAESIDFVTFEALNATCEN